jgi:hypothetical protein
VGGEEGAVGGPRRRYRKLVKRGCCQLDAVERKKEEEKA